MVGVIPQPAHEADDLPNCAAAAGTEDERAAGGQDGYETNDTNQGASLCQPEKGGSDREGVAAAESVGCEEMLMIAAEIAHHDPCRAAALGDVVAWLRGAPRHLGIARFASWACND